MIKKIVCLPVAGLENPYQYLMLQGLNSDENINAISGVDDRFFGILRTAFKHRPDFIHFDWITSYYYRRNLWMILLNIPIFMFQLLVVKYFFRIKLVWTLHNMQPHDTKHPKIHDFCRIFFAKQTSWIRLFSEDSVSRAQTALKVKCNFVVCPEGSYVEYYRNTISRKDARKKLKIDQDDFVYLYLGFIKPYKGIEDLIANFNKLKIENKKLIIAGNVLDKDYYNLIYTKNKDIIFINRFIENDELQDFYKSSNVVVLPFKKVENSGSVILAMGFKKVVIAPKIGVLQSRLVTQNKFLFEDGTLFNKMQLVYEDKDSLDIIGGENFKFLSKNKWEDFKKCF